MAAQQREGTIGSDTRTEELIVLRAERPPE